MNKKNENILFFGIFLTLLTAHVIIFCLLRLYPCIDLPLHLASATIFRYIGEASNVFHEFFSVRPIFGQPNSIHILFCGLNIFPTVEIANKLFYCLYIILLPLSVYHLIKTIGGNQWFTLLSFLYLYNHSVMWGFVDYMISIPLVLFFLSSLYRFIDKERLVDFIVLPVLLTTLFFAHTLTTFLCLSIFFCALIIFHRRSPVKGLLKSLVAVPVIVFTLRWWLSKGSSTGEESTLSAILKFYRSGYWNTFTWRKGFLYWDHSFLYKGHWGYIVGIALSLFVFSILIYTLWKNRISVRSAIRSNQSIFILIFAGLSLLLILSLPMIDNYFIHSYVRFSVFFFLSIIVFGSIFAKKRLKSVTLITITVVACLHFGLWADYFIDFQNENKELNREFFTGCHSDRILAGLIYDYQYRGKPVYIHYPNYHIIWNKAIATTAIVSFQFGWKIDRIKNKAEYPRYDEWIGLFDSYDGRYDNLDYLLVRGDVTEKGQKYLYNFNLFKSSGLYKLYINNQNRK